MDAPCGAAFITIAAEKILSEFPPVEQILLSISVQKGQRCEQKNAHLGQLYRQPWHQAIF
jgi:hypothetical protein